MIHLLPMFEISVKNMMLKKEICTFQATKVASSWRTPLQGVLTYSSISKYE